MKHFKDCCEYLKDNPEGYWFKRKLYGWGWVPVKWQGWLVILAFVAYLVEVGTSLAPNPEPTESELMWFFVKVFGSVIVLILICYKTGESPKWMWGLPSKRIKKDK